jgi:hypothetical protein
MARTAERASPPAPGGATLDFEFQLWAMADGLRGHMDAAERKSIGVNVCKRSSLLSMTADCAGLSSESL